jgi:hypothetical protein
LQVTGLFCLCTVNQSDARRLYTDLVCAARPTFPRSCDSLLIHRLPCEPVINQAIFFPEYGLYRIKNEFSRRVDVDSYVFHRCS